MSDDWIPYCQRDRLPIWRIMTIAASTLASTLLWVIVFSLWTPYANRLLIAPSIQTVILLMGSVIGFIIQPIVGAFSDGTMLKWGRRRIYTICGGIVLVVGFLLMMFCESLGNSNSANQGFLIFGVILTFFAGNIFQGPARTLCSDVTPPNQQVLISSICGVYGGIGGIFTNLIGSLQLYQYTALEQEPFMLVVCLAISFVAIMVTVVTTHEEPLLEKPATINPFAMLLAAIKNMNTVFVRIAIVVLF